MNSDNRLIDASIEVTPEMIEAGVDELYRYGPSEPFEEKMKKAVAAVYRVMASVPLRASTARPRSS